MSDNTQTPDPFEGVSDMNAAPAEKPAPKPKAKMKAEAAAAEAPAARPVTMLVRIKPWNPKKNGHKMRTYMWAGTKFQEGRGWYRVQRAVANYLADVTSNGDPDGPKVFDVVTEDEAQRIEAKERKRLMERASANAPNAADSPREIPVENPGVLTTKNLPRRMT